MCLCKRSWEVKGNHGQKNQRGTPQGDFKIHYKARVVTRQNMGIKTNT